MYIYMCVGANWTDHVYKQWLVLTHWRACAGHHQPAPVLS
jgi:hypothetical protein